MGQIKTRLVAERDILITLTETLSERIEANNDKGVTNSPYNYNNIAQSQKRIKEINKLLDTLILP